MDSATMSTQARPTRTGVGRLFRRVMHFVDDHGLWDEVLARVPPDTANLMIHPPDPSRWIPATPFEDVYTALAAIGGDPLVFKLGMAISRTLGSSIAAPILRSAFALFGSRPTTAFRAANAAYLVASRGIHLEYEDLGEHQGVLAVRFELPVPSHAVLIVVQGTAQWLFELLDMKGTVGPPKVRSQSPTETIVAYEVAYSAG